MKSVWEEVTRADNVAHPTTVFYGQSRTPELQARSTLRAADACPSTCVVLPLDILNHPAFVERDNLLHQCTQVGVALRRCACKQDARCCARNASRPNDPTVTRGGLCAALRTCPAETTAFRS